MFMSRIKQHYYDCIVYIDSKNGDGKDVAGTGFMLGFPVKDQENQFKVFIVTCRHVLKDRDIDIRINTRDGFSETKDTQKTDWKIDSVEDLAVCFLPSNDNYTNIFVRSTYDAFHGDMKERLDIGLGDEAYMLGRFVTLEGEYRNTPVCRFGNIAMMPGEPIPNKYFGHENPGYLVDMGIKEGFSGSPVFIQYRGRTERSGSQSSGPWGGDRLLGMAWGAMEYKKKVQDHTGKEMDAAMVPFQEGLVCVTPAVKIFDFIKKEYPDLIDVEE